MIIRLLAIGGYAFLLAPLLVVTILSVTSDPYLTFPPPGLSLRWYAALAGNADILHAAWNSVVLGALVTATALLAGMPAALAVARRTAPAWVAGALSLPLLLPTLVIGLALLMVLQPLGLLATWPGLALGHLMVVLPFVVRLMVSAFQGLPPQLEEAAATLGARPLRAFVLITLPLAAPGAIAAAVLSFLLSFDETVISLFLVGPRLTTLPVALFHYAESRVDPLLAALAVVLIVLALAIVLLVDRLVGFTRTIGS
jgi:putative spermidine/putrescine transport system permease protein